MFKCGPHICPCICPYIDPYISPYICPYIDYTLPSERLSKYTLPSERLYQIYASFGEALSTIRFLWRGFSVIRFLWRGFINYTLPLERLFNYTRAVFGWGGQRHKATNRQAEQASPPNPTTKSPNTKFNLSLLQPLFGDLVVCAPHDREDHALPIRWEPIFSAEERVLKRGRL